MGRVWSGLGRLLGAVGRFLAVFWTFKIDLFSSLGPRWAPRGLLDRSWVDFGRVWGGFGKILGRFGKVLVGLGKLLDAFSEAFLCQDPRAVSRSSAERLNARGSLAPSV